MAEQPGRGGSVCVCCVVGGAQSLASRWRRAPQKLLEMSRPTLPLPASACPFDWLRAPPMGSAPCRAPPSGCQAHFEPRLPSPPYPQPSRPGTFQGLHGWTHNVQTPLGSFVLEPRSVLFIPPHSITATLLAPAPPTLGSLAVGSTEASRGCVVGHHRDEPQHVTWALPALTSPGTSMVGSGEAGGPG